MRIDEQKSRKMARDIKQNNQELEAPLGDIQKCILDILSTGISKKEAKDMVPKIMMKSDFRDKGYREPSDNEILVYDLPNHLENLYVNPS